MKYDAIQSAREVRQLAQVTLSIAVGLIAASAFQTSALLTVFATMVIMRPLQQHADGPLWEKRTIILTILAFALVWLGSDWTSYQRGVSAGFDAAARISQHSEMPSH